MKWKKLGRIFQADQQFDWMQSHSACPVALHVVDDIYRIYFGTRNKAQHASIGYVEIDLKSPKDILKVSEEPVLAAGPSGFFDCEGVYPACIIEHEGRLLMYYIGWTTGTPPLWYASIGMAESLDGGKTFTKVSPAPILSRSAHDPWIVTSPFVMRENKNDWRMWYTSGVGWKQLDPGVSLYHIKYAAGTSPTDWQREGLVAVDLEGDETNIAAPYIWKSDSIYHMVFCVCEHREGSSSGYRLAFARSEDGLSWTRDDTHVGLDYSAEGWDAQCMAYPSGFQHDGKQYLLYAGNYNGKAGLGLAVCEEE